MTTTAQVLRELDRLLPGERAGRAVGLARELDAADPRALGELLAGLLAGDVPARRLAVLMAAAVGRGALLAAAARDLDSSVSGPALASPALPDEAIVEILDSGSLVERRAAYLRVRTDGRAPLAGRLIEGVRARWGDAEAAALLPAGEAALVARLLPDLRHAVRSWSALVTRHPGVVADFAEAELGAMDGFAARRWWSENESLVAPLLQARPDAVLSLAERHLVGALPTVLSRKLVHLLGVDPGRVVRLVLADPERVAGLSRLWLSRKACARLATLDDATVGALLRAAGPQPAVLLRAFGPRPVVRRQVLRAVPPSRRAAVFDLARAGHEVDSAEIPLPELALLPRERRYAEARRMLGLPQVTRDPALARSVAAQLPAVEAEPVLRAVVGSPDAEERADGYRLLIENAGREGDATEVVALLGWLARVRNERDPVRAEVLAAVSRLPHRLLAPAALPGLDRLIGDALDARDASATTMTGIAELAFRVLWQSAVAGDEVLSRWALGTLERLGGWDERALLSGLPPARALRHGQELALWSYLRAPLAEMLKRDRPEPVLRLAEVLGRRAWLIDELQEMLHQATSIKNDRVIREAVRLWLEPPRTRAERAGRLVAADRSVVTLAPVLAVLVSRRTDLLERHVLSRKPLRGRFGPAKNAIWIPLVAPAVVRWWSPRQQQAYRDLLRFGVDDQAGGRRDRAGFIGALAATPGGGVDAVRDLIDGDDELAAEAALGGLAHTTRPDLALPVLFANVDGGRARVAMYAAAHCARSVRPAILAGVLEPLLAAPKVVVRKEAARLLARTRPPGALEALMGVWQRPDEHRDVRIAVAASLVPFLSDPRARAALREAAGGSDPYLAAAVATVDPRQLSPGERPEYADLVRLVTRHPHGPTAAAALTALAGWFRWAPDARDDLRARLLEFDRIDVWAAAGRTAADPAVWSVDPQLPAALATALIERLDEGENAGAGRDLPARRRLGSLVDEICAHAPELRLMPDPALRLSSVLAGPDGFLVAAARLRVLLAVAGDGAGGHLEAAADLLGDRPVAAAGLGADLPPGDWALESGTEAVDRLIRRPDPAAGLLAVAVVRTAAWDTGWTEPARERLRRLRRHPAAEVRDAAYAVPTADE